MQISHSAITSPVFELVKTVLFDITLGDDYIPTRIEIWQDTMRIDRFRCYVWELEYFNLNPTFPQDDQGSSIHKCTDIVQVERSWRYGRTNRFNYQEFTATSIEEALTMFVDDLKEELEWITDEKAN